MARRAGPDRLQRARHRRRGRTGRHLLDPSRRQRQPSHRPPHVGAVAPSRDGERIAFFRAPRQLWQAASDGSGARPIVRLPRGSGDGPAWSPDGRRLVFTVTVKRRAGQVEEVWVVRLNGKGLRRLRRGGDATWSSRGLIGYSEDGGAVATMRSNGRGRRIWVSQGSPVVVNELDFSSDGLKLVYQQGSLRATRNTIRTVDLRTGARTVFKDMTRDVTAYDVAWVPDSDRLAYVHSPSEGEDVSELRTIAPDGTGRETLFEFPSGLTPFGFAWQTR